MLLAGVIAGAFILPPLPAKAAGDTRSLLRQQAELYVEAYLSKDYETCLSMMGAGIVNALGGKITVLDHYRRTNEALQRHNLKPETISVEEPGPVILNGTRDQYVVIPEKHFYTAKDGKQYILNSYLLAVSEDNGRSWSLLEGSWRISEHIKNHDLALYDRLKLPLRKIYRADDPNIAMLEKGGGFVTDPQTIKYKQSLRQRDNPPLPPPKRIPTY